MYNRFWVVKMAFQGKYLKSTSINGMKMYTLIGEHKSSATWIPPKKIRALRKDKSMNFVHCFRLQFVLFTPDAVLLLPILT